LLLIPVFGLFYSHLPPGSFHDSNIQREQPLAKDAERLRVALSGAINARMTTRTWHALGAPVGVVPARAEVGYVSHTPEGRLVVEVHGYYKGVGRAAGHVAGAFTQWVRIDLNGFIGIGPLGGYLVTLSDPEGNAIKRNAAVPPVSVVFPLVGIGRSQDSTDGVLLMDRTTFSRLAHFYKAAEGDPHYASGLFWRMVYGSAVTVTTVGFGDITPVSSKARLLVGVEAVLGIVFIGLFLNALANRIRPPRASY
jgi:voltage-gated potassium channel Kch